MGLFNLFKRKEIIRVSESEKMNDFKNIAMIAIDFAKIEIENTGSFLPFGAVMTKNNELQMIVYTDPSKTEVDHRVNATIIQNIIMKRYNEPNLILSFMAWDGVLHSESGDIDCINIKIDDKIDNIHKTLTYGYTKNNGVFNLADKENPIIKQN